MKTKNWIIRFFFDVIVHLECLHCSVAFHMKISGLILKMKLCEKAFLWIVRQRQDRAKT